MPGWIGGFVPLLAASSPAADVGLGWYQAWSEPIRQKRGLEAAYRQQSLAWSGFTPVPPGTWFQRLSEPTRRVSSRASQQALAWSGFTPVPPGTWFQRLSEPTRRVSSRASQQALAWSGFTPAGETITVDKWYHPLTTPPKVKASLGAASQQVLVWSGFTPAEIVAEDKWHQPWVPVPRAKLGLGAQYQQASADTLGSIININITGILAAIEIADTALFGGFSFNAPVMGIAGVVEDAVPPSTASPVAAVASISVAIRMI